LFVVRASKTLSVPLGPIWCPAPRACTRSTGESPDTPDTARSEVGSHLSATTSRMVGSHLLFLVAPPLPHLPPFRRRSICLPSQRKISSELGTIVAVGSLAVLFAASASPTRPRTRRKIRPTSAHRRCSAPCLVGAIGHCSLPPLPQQNFNHLFCFRHG
jgi:hypothetical protein